MFIFWYKTIDNKEDTLNFNTYEEANNYWTQHFFDFAAIEITENDKLITLWDNARF